MRNFGWVCGRFGWKGAEQTKYRQRMKTIGSNLIVPYGAMGIAIKMLLRPEDP
jgi:hypothetical protein